MVDIAIAISLLNRIRGQTVTFCCRGNLLWMQLENMLCQNESQYSERRKPKKFRKKKAKEIQKEESQEIFRKKKAKENPNTKSTTLVRCNSHRIFTVIHMPKISHAKLSHNAKIMHNHFACQNFAYCQKIMHTNFALRQACIMPKYGEKKKKTSSVAAIVFLIVFLRRKRKFFLVLRHCTEKWKVRKGEDGYTSSHANFSRDVSSEE